MNLPKVNAHNTIMNKRRENYNQEIVRKFETVEKAQKVLAQDVCNIFFSLQIRFTPAV